GPSSRSRPGPPVPPSPGVDAAADEPAEANEPGDPAAAGDPDLELPIATTLIVQRTHAPQGSACGPGERTRLSSGQVMTLRAPRPALRVVAATGPVFLSFDTEAERDRAAAELLAESGLGPDGSSPPTA